MSPKNKPAKTAANLGRGRGERQPKADVGKVGPETGEEMPTFSFRYADRAFDGAWKWATDVEASQILHFICEMEKLTWFDIKAQMTGSKVRRKRNHYQEVSTLCSAAQSRITQLKLDEIFPEQMFRFRLDGPGRLWGFLVAGIFYVLWWDTDHKVYPLDD